MSKEGIIKKFGSHDRKRLFPGARGRAPQYCAVRQKQAQERLAVWSKMSPQEQLADLDRRLGRGQGAERQRARIKARIEASRSAPTQASSPSGKDLHVKAKDRRAAERAERPTK